MRSRAYRGTLCGTVVSSEPWCTYIVRMPDGNDKVHLQEDGTPLIVGQQMWSKSFTVTKIVKQPDRHGKGGGR